MCNIDYIMDLLDWNNSLEEQQKGIELAREVRSIGAFLQPGEKEHCKNVWDNCAIILSERTDEELTPYLTQLFEWLEDLNWPGALCILDRLRGYSDNGIFNLIYKECINKAKLLGMEMWLSNLLEVREGTEV